MGLFPLYFQYLQDKYHEDVIQLEYEKTKDELRRIVFVQHYYNREWYNEYTKIGYAMIAYEDLLWAYILFRDTNPKLKPVPVIAFKPAPIVVNPLD
jgi:hypothetical protein